MAFTSTDDSRPRCTVLCPNRALAVRLVLGDPPVKVGLAVAAGAGRQLDRRRADALAQPARQGPAAHVQVVRRLFGGEEPLAAAGPVLLHTAHAGRRWRCT